jgi:hypothetical protein
MKGTLVVLRDDLVIYAPGDEPSDQDAADIRAAQRNAMIYHATMIVLPGPLDVFDARKPREKARQ